MNKQLVNMVFSYHQRNKLLSLNDAINFLWQQGVINVGELAEKAIVKKSGKLKQNSRGTKGSDFNDKSDSKYVTVAYYGYASYATISGLRHKVGTLRVMIYEPKTSKNYFFKIPHKIYAPYQQNNDTLKVYFDSEGNPKHPIKQNKRYDLWDYRCSVEDWAK